MGGPIDMEHKGCESIGCYTHFVTFNLDLNHDLDLGFSRSNFEKVVSQEWDGRLTWNERDVSRYNVGHMLWFSTFTSPMTLALDFQGQILKMLYLRNGMADWHGTKGMWVDRMLHPLCNFQLWPQPWPWPWIFKVKFKKKLYLRNGMADWHGTKGMWVDIMLDPCCDFQRSLHPWPWPWIFKVKFWKCCISGMGWLIDLERKGCESIECWTHGVTFNVHLNHDLDLGFSRPNFSIAIDRNVRAHRHRMKVIWVDRVLYLLCGLQVWHWPWIFKVKFWKCCISGMGGPVDMERKGCESIGCYTYIVTSNFDLSHDLDLGFSW